MEREERVLATVSDVANQVVRSEIEAALCEVVANKNSTVEMLCVGIALSSR